MGTEQTWTAERRRAAQVRLAAFKAFVAKQSLQKDRLLLERVVQDLEAMLRELERRRERIDDLQNANAGLRSELQVLRPLAQQAENLSHQLQREQGRWQQTRAALRVENRQLRAKLKVLEGK